MTTLTRDLHLPLKHETRQRGEPGVITEQLIKLELDFNLQWQLDERGLVMMTPKPMQSLRALTAIKWKTEGGKWTFNFLTTEFQ